MQPLLFTLWFFCSICFLRSLEAFSPQLVDSNMSLDPSTRDRTSLNIGPCFVVVSILVQGKSLFQSKCYVLWTFQEVSHRKFMKTCPHFRGVSLGAYKQRRILYPKSDFPCNRIETTTSSLGLKCTPKQDLLLGVVYSLKQIAMILTVFNPQDSRFKIQH